MTFVRFLKPAFLIGMLGWCALVYAEVEEVRLARFSKSANQYVAAQILTEVYRQAGLVARVEAMPPLRTAREALAGRIDGEVSRIKTHGDDNPGLIRITPAYNHITMHAFSRLPIAIESAVELKKYRVGIVRGLQAAMDITEGLEGVEKAVNTESLFLMMAAGRVDVAIDVDVNGAFQIAKHDLKGFRPVGTLLKAEAFNYLSPNKAYLQPRISATITEMKKSGELDRLRRKFSLAFVKNGIEPD